MAIMTTFVKIYSSEYAKVDGNISPVKIFGCTDYFPFSPTHFLAASNFTFAMSFGFAFFLGGPSIIYLLCSDPPA